MTPCVILSLLSHTWGEPLLLQECSPCPWRLCKGWITCPAAGHAVMGTFPRCHQQLWPVTPLNTTHILTPQLLWLWGQSLVVSMLKSPPTPTTGQQQEPKPRKWDTDPSGKERRSQNYWILRVGKDLRNHQVQPLTKLNSRTAKLYLKMTRPLVFLNISIGDDSSTSLLQCLTTLPRKNFFPNN